MPTSSLATTLAFEALHPNGGAELLDLSRTSRDLLDPIAAVVGSLLSGTPELSDHAVMLVGARCRDVLHSALGGTFQPVVTLDVDLALAVSSWDAYRTVCRTFPLIGDTGIRFQVEGMKVDLMPFGAVEDPVGVVVPPVRGEPMSVWAFAEIFEASLPLALSPELEIRIPTVAGFAAAKIGAWLDRVEWQEVKDASDLALIAYWYAESEQVHDRLYTTTGGERILLEEDLDVLRATSRLLGEDVITTIGSVRAAELLERWPRTIERLNRSYSLTAGPTWPGPEDRRRASIDAMTRGLRGARLGDLR